VILLDLEGRVRSYGDDIPRMTGANPEQLLDGSLAELFREESGGDLQALLADLARGAPGARVLSFEVRSRQNRDAGPFGLSVLRVSPDTLAAVVEREPALEEREDVVALLESSWNRTDQGMALCSTPDRPDGPTIIAVNNMFGHFFDVPPERARGRPLLSILDPPHAQELLARIRSELAQRVDTIFDQIIGRDVDEGASLLEWEISAIRSPDGNVRNLLCLLRDITDASVRNRTLRRPDVDPLTGLPNEAHFLRRLERSVEHAAQGRQYAFAVVGIEVAGLEAAEKRWGSVVSHLVMEAFIFRVKECLRPSDLIARVGPYRLAALLEHFGPWGHLERVLGRLRSATQDPYTVGGDEVRLAVTGGAVPVWGQGNVPHDAKEVMEELEQSLDRARRIPTADARAPSGVGPQQEPPQEEELAHALESGQLRLHYLPLVSLETGEVIGLEALVRWLHPFRGLVQSREFISEAERTGLIVSMGRWVLARVCRQLQSWQARAGGRRPPAIHVNVSAPEFWHSEFPAYLREQVRESGIDPASLCLEVHESTLSGNVKGARQVLAQLSAIGVGILLDGFGGGGIPLSELPQLPIRHAKLGSSVMWELKEDEVRPSPLLNTLILLAHNLGWRIAGAGVETASQRDLLLARGCDLGQGFFFSEGVDDSQADLMFSHPA
jgi:EAL domain-containing protein (putative c-di-GMP-specific phosphodiesterase class I)/GGDEF domain-containing protein/PAS domain-containing protein